MDIQTAAATLFSLSHETRLAVFRLLVRAGPEGLPAGEIANQLDVRQNTMSSHLDTLSRASLVISTREGRVVRYSANHDGMRRLMLFLVEDCCQGEEKICHPLKEALCCLSA